MFPTTLRFLLVAVALIAAIATYRASPIRAAMFLAGAILLAIGLRRYGTVWLAFRAQKQGRTERSKELLDQIANPDRLSPQSRAYYHLLRGIHALEAEDYAAADASFARINLAGLRTDNDRNVASGLRAKAAAGLAPESGVHLAVDRHLRAFFAGHTVREHQWQRGPAKDELPRLRVLEIAPGPRATFFSYVTRGAFEASEDNPFEYLLTTDTPSERFVEILTILAYYGRRHALGTRHVMPIGEPLVAGSQCDSLYLSLPYRFGPELEVCDADTRTIRVLWAFPITAAEHEFAQEHGGDALEQRFEEGEVEYWSPTRPSVV